METNFIINNYLSELYAVYTKHNFRSFLYKFNDFNVNCNNFKKNNLQNIEKIKNRILNLFAENKAKISYFESKKWSKFQISYFNDICNDSNLIVLDLPIFEEDFTDFMLTFCDFLSKNKISLEIWLCKQISNPLIKLKLYNVNDIKFICDFFSSDSKINSIVKSRVIPILYQDNLIGIYKEIKPFSFKTFYAKYLYSFFSIIKDEKYVSLDNFFRYIDRCYKNENNLNEKRMLELLYKYIEIILYDKSFYELFNNNVIMDISSIDHNNYNIKVNKDSFIFFENKMDGSIIEYGSEDFLNICYSKYYDNVIKKETSNAFYDKYYSIFSSLLSSNYKETNKLLMLMEKNMDNTYKILSLASGMFFAYKKMNFPLKIVYSLLDNALPDYNDIDKNNDSISNKYILDKEYANKLIKLKGGSIVKIEDIFYRHNLINSIPTNAKIHLKDGSKVSGKDFLDNIYLYIDKYENFDEMMDDIVLLIEYN